MYIRNEDFMYLETLHKSLDGGRRKKFIKTLLKAAGKRAGTDISKIQIIRDETLDVRGIEPVEIVTRTMIQKAFKAAKEEA